MAAPSGAAQGKDAQALPGTGKIAQALPGEVVETLKHMNASSQKYAKWVVRVVQGRIVQYQFTARGEVVQASKFFCILVSKNPKEYMQGVVPFNFTNKTAAADAVKKFLDATCWEISSPCLESSQKAEYISCPIKTVVKLTQPTGLRPITPAETEKYNYASRHIHPPSTLAEIMTLLGQVRFQARPSLTSGLSPATKMVDLSCKIRSRGGEARTVTKNGKTHTILNLEVVDDSTLQDGTKAQVEIAVWDKAIAAVPHGVNAGVCIVGCTAAKDGEGMKLNVWDSAFWITTGARASALTDMALAQDDTSFTTLTTVFSGAGERVDVSGTATPTCVVKLAGVERDAVISDKDLVFQMNRCLLEASAASKEEMFTRDGSRLFVRATVRDWTGACEVDVLEEGVPALFGLSDKSEVEARLCQPDMGGMVVQSCRVNVRGVIRIVKGVIKKYIANIMPSPLTATISGNALVALRGLSEIGNDVVVVAPADRISHCPLVGMAVKSDSDMKLQAHRIVMLVTGTTKSKLNPITKAPGSASDCFFVETFDVKCELSQTSEHVHLRGYCDFNNMLEYRLDSESAVIVVSAVDDEENGPKKLTVESMQKVSKSELENVVKSMTVEWKAALTKGEFSQLPSEAPSSSEYWNASNHGVKRLLSEPATPARRKRSS